MEKLYSDQDIRQKLKNKVSVHLYSDLHEFDNINQVLGPHKAAVILYEQLPHFGHWCCVFEHNGILNFFDPYGIVIDGELKFIDRKFRMKNNEDYGYLAMLLACSPLPVDYNEYQMQSHAAGINTCGRWCVARIENKDLTTDEFAETFTPDVAGLIPDNIIVPYTDML